MTWLHRFAKLLSAATFLLLIAGGLVTSTGSGLSVPDWPTTYGWSMFTYPYSRWVGGIFYEHSHRLLASSIGMLTILLVVWIWRRESRLWMRMLSLCALAAVVAQGVLGGITVLTKLPAPVSVGHAGLGQIFFCLTVAMSLFTSRGWQRAYAPERMDELDVRHRHELQQQSLAADVGFRRTAVATVGIIFVQILLGATMRHTGAGLAIPDFPLSFGGIVPSLDHLAAPGVAIHFAHRVWAVVTLIAIYATVARIVRLHATHPELVRPAWLISALVPIQIALGGLVVLTGRDVGVNTAHVAVGALVLATSLVIALRAHRPLFATGVAVASTERVPAVGLAPRSRPASA